MNSTTMIQINTHVRRYPRLKVSPLQDIIYIMSDDKKLDEHPIIRRLVDETKWLTGILFGEGSYSDLSPKMRYFLAVSVPSVIVLFTILVDPQLLGTLGYKTGQVLEPIFRYFGATPEDMQLSWAQAGLSVSRWLAQVFGGWELDAIMGAIKYSIPGLGRFYEAIRGAGHRLWPDLSSFMAIWSGEGEQGGLTTRLLPFYMLRVYLGTELDALSPKNLEAYIKGKSEFVENFVKHMLPPLSRKDWWEGLLKPASMRWAGELLRFVISWPFASLLGLYATRLLMTDAQLMQLNELYTQYHQYVNGSLDVAGSLARLGYTDLLNLFTDLTFFGAIGKFLIAPMKMFGFSVRTFLTMVFTVFEGRAVAAEGADLDDYEAMLKESLGTLLMGYIAGPFRLVVNMGEEYLAAAAAVAGAGLVAAGYEAVRCACIGVGLGFLALMLLLNLSKWFTPDTR